MSLILDLFIPVCSIVFNATVSLDGSGDFKSIGAAISAAPDNSNSRFYIRIKSGTYNEHIEVESQKTFITLIGDNAATTVIVDSRSNGTGFGTSQSATFGKLELELYKLFLSSFFFYHSFQIY